MDDAELVAAAQRGEREAFDELVRRTYRETFTLAYRLTGNEEDARDVVQDAYLRAWRGLGKFRGDAQFSTWMYRITANAASTLTDRRRRRRTEPIDDVHDPADDRPDGQPAARLDAAERGSELAEAVATLPAKLRTVVVLKDVYDLSHEEIADELGISVSAAKVRLHRGRKRLRDLLYDDEERARAV